MYNAETIGVAPHDSVLEDAAKTAGRAVSVDAIRSWLTAEISELLSVDAHDIVIDEPFANYGLSSMTGVILSGNIEEWLAIQVDPAAAWEYPTIELLAGHLAELVNSARLAGLKKD